MNRYRIDIIESKNISVYVDADCEYQALIFAQNGMGYVYDQSPPEFDYKWPRLLEDDD